MMKRNLVLFTTIVFGILLSAPAFAHTPLCSCAENGDGTITCEGGFFDGSSASGVKMRVEDEKGTAVVEGKMDNDSEFTFKKPAGDFQVVFDGGEGHVLKVAGKSIAK